LGGNQNQTQSQQTQGEREKFKKPESAAGWVIIFLKLFFI
jgi:hypothetical protein